MKTFYAGEMDKLKKSVEKSYFNNIQFDSQIDVKKSFKAYI